MDDLGYHSAHAQMAWSQRFRKWETSLDTGKSKFHSIKGIEKPKLNGFLRPFRSREGVLESTNHSGLRDLGSSYEKNTVVTIQRQLRHSLSTDGLLNDNEHDVKMIASNEIWWKHPGNFTGCCLNQRSINLQQQSNNDRDSFQTTTQVLEHIKRIQNNQLALLEPFPTMQCRSIILQCCLSSRDFLML